LANSSFGISENLFDGLIIYIKFNSYRGQRYLLLLKKLVTDGEEVSLNRERLMIPVVGNDAIR